MINSIVHTITLFSLLSFMLITPTHSAEGTYAYSEKLWCVADEQTPDDALQKALDWACGLGGADCKMIQPHKPCYLPNTAKDHASYAFNSYWQKYKNKGGSCYFRSAAMLTALDPSHDSCQYEELP